MFHQFCYFVGVRGREGGGIFVGKKRIMKNNTLTIIPAAATPVNNLEDAPRGHAAVALNLRERDNCLTAVGRPAITGSLAAGHRLLLIHDGHLITARERDIAIDGDVITTSPAAIKQAHAFAAFVVITTAGACIVLHRNGDTYHELNIDDAIVPVTLGASAMATFTASIPALTFHNPYRSWQAPLSADDQALVLNAVKQARANADNAARAAGRYTGPLLVRYALRLWDDEYLWMSQPILVGTDTLQPNYRTALTVTVDDSRFAGTVAATMSVGAYAVTARATQAVAPQWQPLVKAIDILATPAAAPVGNTLDYRCASSTASGSRVYLLEAGLTPRTENALWSSLFKQSWTVIATAAVNGDIPVFNDIAAPSLRFTGAQLEPLMRRMSYLPLGAAALLHDGLMHLAPAATLPTCNWRIASWAVPSGDLTPCPATASILIAGSNGTRLLTLSETLPFTPAALNPLLAVHDTRATALTVTAGGNTWHATLLPWQEAGMAIAVASMTAGHTPQDTAPATGDTPPVEPAEVRGSMEVSRLNNPLVYATENLAMSHRVLALARAGAPIYNGGFGRYPIYLFTDGGVFALAQGSSAYGSTRPLAGAIINEEIAPVNADDMVWFIDNRDRLCALKGAVLTTHADDTATAQLAWNGFERELVMRSHDNEVAVKLPSGRFYRRDTAWQQLYCDETHCLAVDTEGHILDLTREDFTRPVHFVYQSVPFTVSGPISRVVWSVHAHDAALSLSMHGYRCPPRVNNRRTLLTAPVAQLCSRDGLFLIASLSLTGNPTRPIPMVTPPTSPTSPCAAASPAIPHRAVTLRIDGTATGAAILPVTVS